VLILAAVNRWVAGSNPARGATLINDLEQTKSVFRLCQVPHRYRTSGSVDKKAAGKVFGNALPHFARDRLRCVKMRHGERPSSTITS
jgi:hypothetical protein